MQKNHDFVPVQKAVRVCKISEKRLREAIESGAIRHILLCEQRPGVQNRPIKHVSLKEVQALKKTLETCMRPRGRPKKVSASHFH